MQGGFQLGVPVELLRQEPLPLQKGGPHGRIGALDLGLQVLHLAGQRAGIHAVDGRLKRLAGEDQTKVAADDQLEAPQVVLTEPHAPHVLQLVQLADDLLHLEVVAALSTLALEDAGVEIDGRRLEEETLPERESRFRLVGEAPERVEIIGPLFLTLKARVLLVTIHKEANCRPPTATNHIGSWTSPRNVPAARPARLIEVLKASHR